MKNVGLGQGSSNSHDNFDGEVSYPFRKRYIFEFTFVHTAGSSKCRTKLYLFLKGKRSFKRFRLDRRDRPKKKQIKLGLPQKFS